MQFLQKSDRCAPNFKRAGLQLSCKIATMIFGGTPVSNWAIRWRNSMDWVQKQEEGRKMFKAARCMID